MSNSTLLALSLLLLHIAIASGAHQNAFVFKWRPTAYLLDGHLNMADGFDGELDVDNITNAMFERFDEYQTTLAKKYNITNGTEPISRDSVGFREPYDLLSNTFTIYCHGNLIFREVRVCFELDENNIVAVDCHERSNCRDKIIVPNNLDQKISCNIELAKCLMDDQIVNWLEAANFDNQEWSRFYSKQIGRQLELVIKLNNNRVRDTIRTLSISETLRLVSQVNAVEANVERLEAELENKEITHHYQPSSAFYIWVSVAAALTLITIILWMKIYFDQIRRCISRSNS